MHIGGLRTVVFDDTAGQRSNSGRYGTASDERKRYWQPGNERKQR
jgi:hypothetical protein